MDPLSELHFFHGAAGVPPTLASASIEVDLKHQFLCTGREHYGFCLNKPLPLNHLGEKASQGVAGDGCTNKASLAGGWLLQTPL